MRSSGIVGSMTLSLAMAVGLAASAQSSIRPSPMPYSVRPRANQRNKGESGDKLLSKMGKIGLGMHSTGRMPLGEGTVSPKKDIGKGPARTLSARGLTLSERKFRKVAKAARRSLKGA